jgi:hypothetical protein
MIAMLDTEGDMNPKIADPENTCIYPYQFPSRVVPDPQANNL